MKTTSYYPVLMAGDVAATADFYVEHFRFRRLFDSGWYVHLQSTEDKRVNLGIVAGRPRDHPGAGAGPDVRAAHQFRGQGRGCRSTNG